MDKMDEIMEKVREHRVTVKDLQEYLNTEKPIKKDVLARYTAMRRERGIPRKPHEEMSIREAQEELMQLRSDLRDLDDVYSDSFVSANEFNEQLIYILEIYFGITKESFMEIIKAFDKKIESITKAINSAMDNTKIGLTST